MILAKRKERTFIRRKKMHISTVLINLLVIVLSFSPRTEAQASYIYHMCPNTTDLIFTRNSTYQTNRNSVLSSLSSNGTRENGFYNTTSGRSPDMVYGLFLCRGDVSISVCQKCVTFATNDISRRCPVEKVAVVWYDECLLRYSNEYIFSGVSESPGILLSNRNTQNATDQNSFNQLVTATMNDTATKAANESSGGRKFATNEANFSSSQTLYTLVQCTPDLSSADCNICLQGAIGNLPNCCSGKQGGRVLLPSCNVRYEIYRFYNITAVAAPPPPPSLTTPPPPPPPSLTPPPPPGGSQRSWPLIISILAPIAATMLLFFLAC